MQQCLYLVEFEHDHIIRFTVRRVYLDTGYMYRYMYMYNIERFWMQIG